MVAEYALEIVDHHTIVDFDGFRALIDTGSPMSFGIKELPLFGESLTLQSDLAPLTAESLSENVGCELHGLVGQDILGEHHVLVNWATKRFEISKHELGLVGSSVAADQLGSVPVVQIALQGWVLRAFFDTGAKISYLSSRFLTGPPSQERREPDFHPLFGSFETPIFEREISFAGGRLPVRFGQLPAKLEETFLGGGIRAVIGSDILARYAVAFEMPLNRITVKRF